MRLPRRIIWLGVILPLIGCNLRALPPVTLTIQSDVAAGGFHSVYLDETGQVWTWGDNRFGQLGNEDTTEPLLNPEVVSALPSIARISAGGSHTMALTTDGQVWTWGGNHDNTLGVSTSTTTQATPVLIPNLDHVMAIAAGDGHGVALRSNGTVWTWGINMDGQLGLPQDSNHPFPEQVAEINDAIAIAAGNFHTLIVRQDGSVWAAGLNNHGQLGDGTTVSRTEFKPVPGLTNVQRVSAGESYSMALDRYGDVWTWGDNDLGATGNDATTPAAPQHPTIPPGVPYVGIAAGGSHALALNENGVLWSWGYNGHGQLGYQTAEPVSPVPESVPIVEAIITVVANETHSIALSQNQAIITWGDNSFGQLGDGSTQSHFEPTAITFGDATTMNEPLHTQVELSKSIASASDWSITTVDAEGDVGVNTALAFDSNSSAHIIYQDVMESDLKYATNATGVWVTEVIATERNVGSFSDVVLDTTDQPRVCFYVSGLSLNYATRGTDGHWKIETVDDAGDVGGYCSIGLDSTGQVHMSYYDWSEKDLKYAHGRPGAWLTETLATAGDIGTETSLQIDGADHVHIAYYEPEHFNEHYITNRSGTWEDTSIEPLPGETSGTTRLALTSSGEPRLIYNWQGDLHYAEPGQVEWDIATISVNSLQHPSFTLDPAGQPYITLADYDYETSTSFLKFIRLTEGDWEETMISSSATNQLGLYADIAIAPNGTIGASYYDRTAGDLFYAQL